MLYLFNILVFRLKPCRIPDAENRFLNLNLARSTPLFLRCELRCKHVVLFIFRTEFVIRKLIRIARSSFRDGNLGTPFSSEFSVYSADMYEPSRFLLLRYLFKYDFNSVSKFIIIFILLISFLFRSTLTVRRRNLR